MPRRAFTLLELLVVVAVLAVLVGLLLPAVQKARGAAARAACQSNLRQVGVALHAYHDARMEFPPGYVSEVDPLIKYDLPPGWGWAAYTLPYLGQGPLADAADLSRTMWEGANAAVARTPVPVLVCPADAVPAGVPVGRRHRTGALVTTFAVLAPASYAGSFGVGEPGIDGDGLFFRNSRVRLGEVADGTSTTMLVGERSFAYSETVWAGVVSRAGYVPTPGSPVPFQIDESANFVLGHTGEMTLGAAVPTEVNSYSSQHFRSSNYLFCDGSVRLLTAATDYELLKALSTRAEGEVFSKEPE